MNASFFPLPINIRVTQMAQITKTLIDKMKCPPNLSAKNFIIWDSTVPGFGVRVTLAGTKSFVLRYSFEGHRRVLHTLGQYGVFTLEEARRFAISALQRLALGENPFAEKAAHINFKEFSEIYIQRHASRKKSGKNDKELIDNYLSHALGTTDLRNINRGQISTIHSKLGEKHPYNANRLLSLVSVMWNKAIEWGYLPDELDTKNPAKRIQRFPEVKRSRFVTPDEMPTLLQCINDHPSIYIRSALKLYLLTGFRKSELLSLEWNLVNLKDGHIELLDTKAGRGHYLPLCKEAVEIFRKIPRRVGNKYVFPGKFPKTHLKDLKSHWQEIRQKAGYPDLRIHDLRRTVGSWMAIDGASLPLIGKVLNHSNVNTTQIYARFHTTPVREAMEKLSVSYPKVEDSSPAKSNA